MEHHTQLVSIIIVNWNAGCYLKACIDSINKYSAGLVKQIIIVDNGSTDGSDQTVENLPNVILVRAEKNLGFAKACNLGAKYSNSKYLLFLNPDTELFEHSLQIPINFMEDQSNVKIGICGIQLINSKGEVARSCSRFPSLLGIFSQATTLSLFYKRLGVTMKEWEHNQTKIVDQVIGAFFLVRHEIFNKLNGFDECFFVYFEEVDFSYRAKKLGIFSIYMHEANAFHLENGTTNKIKATRLFYSLRSRLIYSLKHFNKISFFFTLIITLFLEPISRSFFAIYKRSFTSFKEVWIAYGMLWKWLATWLFKEKTC